MPSLSRRSFLRGSAVGAAALATSGLWRPGLTSARAQALARALAPEGTTLEMALGRPEGTGYRRLAERPGWPIEVRGDLAEPSAGREDRRTALATIVHLTDIHIIDAQSPARVEFVDRYADPPTDPFPISSAWRPQEPLTGHIADAMVRQINSLGRGPVTGRAYDAAVSTGDNTDNQQYNELDWLLTVLDGGSVTVNSGSGDYVGVQDTDPTWFDDEYWHPDDVANPVTGSPDTYKSRHGFPTMAGLLDAAVAPFDAQGLNCPWYSCYGNHDGLLQGNAPAVPPLGDVATGPLKVTGVPAGLDVNDVTTALQSGDPNTLGSLLDTSASPPARPVPADEDRRPIDPVEWVRLHQQARGGPGPVGHGYGDRALATGELYYTFDLGDGVLGIVMDSVNRGGVAEGSLGQAQLDWIEQRLVEVHGRYLDADGREVTTSNDDRLVVLFSHHNSGTMNNPTPDLAMPTDRRVLGDEVVAFLNRFPNVVAWINGHSHTNRVWARPDPAGQTGGFWEINTAAHVDAPQHARIVEIADNRDGTLSIFGTLIDHAAPAQVPHDDRTPLGLASLARELSYNDPQAGTPGATGSPGDRNVELLLTRPFDPAGTPVATPAPDRTTPDQTPPAGTPAAPVTAAAADARAPLPSTGGGAAGLLGGAAAITAATALRRRGGVEPVSPDAPQD